MSYVEKNLIAGEQVEFRTRLHPIVFASAIALGVIGLSLFALNAALAISVLCIAALFAIPVSIAVASSEFAVTNRRVIFKVGFIRRRTVEMLLSKVESIEVNQGIVGRMFDYGDIVVIGTGATKEPFKDVSAPLALRQAVQAGSLEAPHGLAGSDGDVRTCPFCAEQIKRAAIVCRYCGRDVPALR